MSTKAAPLDPGKNPKAKKLLAITNRLLREQGWETMFEFKRRSGVPYSTETVRKIFHGSGEKNVEPATVAVVLKYLNVPAYEIRRILKEATDDHDLWTLLPEAPIPNGNSFHALSPAEDAWLGIFRKVSEKAEAIQALLPACRLASMVAQEDISKELTILERKVV